MELKVLRTLQFGEMLLVICDWMEFAREEPTLNLYAYDANGGRLWIAEERHLDDFFTGFVGDGQSLQVSTWNGFCCTLDAETGKIISSEFTK